jgi:hypothetical protein
MEYDMKFQPDLIRSPTRVQPINPENKKIAMLTHNIPIWKKRLKIGAAT